MLRQAVARWGKDIAGMKWISEQNIDPLQSYRLNSLLSSVLASYYPTTSSLPRPSTCTESSATSLLPLGAHFVYHNPVESKLSFDGYSGYQAPQNDGKELFARRMWAGGNIRFRKDLPMNEAVKCTEEVTAVRQMHGQCFVSIERKFTDPTGVVEYLTEKRTLVYTNENYKHDSVTVEVDSDKVGGANFSSNGPWFKIDATQNFRFSALTYNAHRIHYDSEYCRIEGLAGPIISGPFIITILLNLFSRFHPEARISAVRYRNRLVILENTQFTLLSEVKEEKGKDEGKNEGMHKGKHEGKNEEKGKVYAVTIRSANAVLVDAEITV